MNSEKPELLSKYDKFVYLKAKKEADEKLSEKEDALYDQLEE